MRKSYSATLDHQLYRPPFKRLAPVPEMEAPPEATYPALTLDLVATAVYCVFPAVVGGRDEGPI